MKNWVDEKERANLIKKSSGVTLEIGFGSGLNLPFYENTTKLYALDPSKELWSLAKERINAVSFPVEFIEASAEKIPLADNTVDTVVSTWTLCSIPKPELALKEIKRILKPNGKFIFIEHGKSPEEKIFQWQKRLNPIWGRLAGGCQLDKKPDTLLSNTGFEIVELEKGLQCPQIFSYMYKGSAIIKKGYE